VIGPTLLLNLRKMSESAAIQGSFFMKMLIYLKLIKLLLGCPKIQVKENFWILSDKSWSLFLQLIIVILLISRIQLAGL
jgi:hypothetical protein